MKLVDRARLVQALNDTSVLVACHIDPARHSVATKELQQSIAQLLGELKRDNRLNPASASQTNHPLLVRLCE